MPAKMKAMCSEIPALGGICNELRRANPSQLAAATDQFPFETSVRCESKSVCREHRPKFGPPDIAMDGPRQKTHAGPRKEQRSSGDIPSRDSSNWLGDVSTGGAGNRMEDRFD